MCVCVCVCVCVYQELNFLAEEESIEWPFILVMTYVFLLLLINYLPKWAYENLYRPLCNCACCCNDCSVSCYYFSLTCDSPFFFFFFLKSCMLSFLQIQIQAVLLGVNLMLLKLQLLLVLLRYVIISWKNSYEHSAD